LKLGKHFNEVFANKHSLIPPNKDNASFMPINLGFAFDKPNDIKV
jgi:hypothetical protein